MQMTTEARAWLDATVRRILARHPVGDPERAGVTYELMSHLHASGEARAQAAGRDEVRRDDLEAALAEAGGEEGLSAAFVEPLAKPVERVLFWRRFGAFLVDAVLVLILIGAVHGALPPLLEPVFGGAAFPPHDLWLDVASPWAYHDVALPVATQLVIAVASWAVVLTYFGWLEAAQGRTLGKLALGLRVVRADGQPMTWRESLLRNAAKLIPLLLVVDTVALLLPFRKDRQRGSDKLAQTIVIRA